MMLHCVSAEGRTGRIKTAACSLRRGDDASVKIYSPEQEVFRC
jgi:hypothetical protein